MVVLAIWLTAASLHTIPTQPMEALSQLDVQSPDHVSVITRDGKVTISVVKDGTSVTLGFPLKNQVFNTTPRPPLQQPVPQVMAVKQSTKRIVTNAERGYRFAQKLTESQVRELKQILADPEIMAKFPSKTKAYHELGRIYGVSHCRISQIANGNGWNHIQP